MTVSSETTHEIVDAWRQTIEASQESGMQPSLLIGQSETLSDGLPALSACRRLARTRTDLAAPQLLAGGSSAWWSTALLHGVLQADAAGDKSVSPAMVARFAGADAATVMAMLTVHASPRGSETEYDWFNGLPAGMASCLQPQSASGAITPWTSLPMAVMTADMERERAAAIDWTAVAAVILALCIVVMSLILSVTPSA